MFVFWLQDFCEEAQIHPCGTEVPLAVTKRFLGLSIEDDYTNCYPGVDSAVFQGRTDPEFGKCNPSFPMTPSLIFFLKNKIVDETLKRVAKGLRKFTFKRLAVQKYDHFRFALSLFFNNSIFRYGWSATETDLDPDLVEEEQDASTEKKLQNLPKGLKRGRKSKKERKSGDSKRPRVSSSPASEFTVEQPPLPAYPSLWQAVKEYEEVCRGGRLFMLS